MEAVYFGTCIIWGKGAGNGPWVMGDLENGLWAGERRAPTPQRAGDTTSYVTGMVKGDDAGKNHWTIKVGNAQSRHADEAVRRSAPELALQPDEEGRRHRPRHRRRQQQRRQGNWFEGVMTPHYSSDAADDAVQANIVSVYGQVQ